MKKVKCFSLKEKIMKYWSAFFVIGEVYDVLDEDEDSYLLMDKDESDEPMTWWVDKKCFIQV